MEKLYEGVTELLNKLKTRYKLGIIANQSLGTEQRLKEYGIHYFFDVIIASAEVGLEKPNPDIFKLAIKSAGCNPDEAYMVGDRLDNDIEPAGELGMHTIWVRQGSFAYGNIDLIKINPEFIADSIREILEIL